MKIYPLHLRQKRVNTHQSPYINQRIIKMNESFNKLFNDLEELKRHLAYMDEKYLGNISDLKEGINRYKHKED